MGVRNGSIMLKIVLVAHLTYKNQWLNSNTKIQTFGQFGTPNWVCLFARGGEGAGGGMAVASTIVLKDVGCW